LIVEWRFYLPRLFYLPLVEPGVLLSLKAANKKYRLKQSGGIGTTYQNILY